MKRRLLEYLSLIINYTRRITLPGFQKIPIYDVGEFFLRELFKGDLQIRARAIAFSFFLAIFPAIIFLFTLIPYVPIDGFQERLLSILQSLLLTTLTTQHTRQ